MKQLLERASGLLFPNVCEFCAVNAASRAESYICAECRAKPDAIIRIEPPFCDVCGLPYQGDITTQFQCSNCSDLGLKFTAARAAVRFDNLLREVIHRYKYGGREWHEDFLATLFIEAATPDLTENPPDLIVPIPLHPARRRYRGFNQAERLAQRLGAATNIPVDAKILRRVKNTESQTQFDRRARIENVKGAFEYAGKESLKEQKIVLIDDVLTLGVTADACAKALILNGAGEVRVWTVARGGVPQ